MGRNAPRTFCSKSWRQLTCLEGNAVIQDVQELTASLDYATKWADTLEGLRRHAQETDAALLPTTSARPLSEIRRVLAEAREFVSRLDQETETNHRRVKMSEWEKVS